MMLKGSGFITELYEFLTKILIPSILAITLKLAVTFKAKKEKLTFLNVFLSFSIGISSAYFASPLIDHESRYYSVFIAVIAISGERITEYLIYHVDVKDLIAYFTGLKKPK